MSKKATTDSRAPGPPAVPAGEIPPAPMKAAPPDHDQLLARITKLLTDVRMVARLNTELEKIQAKRRLQGILQAAQSVLEELEKRRVQHGAGLRQLAETEWHLMITHPDALREAYRVQGFARNALQLLMLPPNQLRWALDKAQHLSPEPREREDEVKQIQWQIGKALSAPAAFDHIFFGQLRPALENFAFDLESLALAAGVPIGRKAV